MITKEEQYAMEKIMERLLRGVKEQRSLGLNQVVYHKEYYAGGILQ